MIKKTPMTSPAKLFKERNLRPNKQLGQNFLKDPSTAAMIIDRAKILPEDVILEIGAGLGALTIPLARTARKVFAVEKDRMIVPLLQNEILAHQVDRVMVLNKNILEVDLRKITERENRKLVVIGNLPYNISSQVLVRLITDREYIRHCILMFQKELVGRITAQPGGRDYGRLSVMLQYCANVKKIAQVKASLFFPQPKVDSEVVEIKFKNRLEFPSDDEAFLFKVIKAAFSKRRKMLKNSLGTSELDIDIATAGNLLEKIGINPSRRAETLTVEEFVRLGNTIYKEREGESGLTP